MIVMGIESSCDEFAVAVINSTSNKNEILSSITATQIEQHKQFGGVAPEVAARLHVEMASPTIKEALSKASLSPKDLNGIAYTNRPGLVGSLIVGSCIAKSMAMALSIPSVAIDHIEAHLFVNHLSHPISFPYIGLIVSGGHTVIMLVHSFKNIEVLGSTIDDAIGECYDKIAKHHSWGYPGGPVIDKMSQSGDHTAYNFPMANLYKGDHTYDVSYSGLKNAVANQKAQFHIEGKSQNDNDIAASFQEVALNMLIAKLKKALKNFNINTIVMGGGVAANSALRSKLSSLKFCTVYYPPLKHCTDNGDMIAFLGSKLLQEGITSPITTGVQSRVVRFKRFLK